ncbi:MAG: transposase [Candidatus Zixiibacteriota bacterium]|nr:MAG: transposase [candidate division Zixibacteria bacterium]
MCCRVTRPDSNNINPKGRCTLPLRKRNLIKDPTIFFLTTTTSNRRNFPHYPECLRIIERTLFDTVQDKSVSLFGYVIMPSHIHLLAGCKDGGPGMSRFIHSLKGRVRINLNHKGPLWEERFDDLVIKSEKQFRIKLDYIHYNPVKDNLVENPDDWPYSSFLDWKNQDDTKGILFDFDKFY